MQYGLISHLDGRTIERTFDKILASFTDKEIKVTEIGIFSGGTAKALKEYLRRNDREIKYTAIDNQKDFKMDKPFPEAKFIIGNSIEVYNQIEPASQHFIFQDANHSFPMTIADFFCYESKVIRGGFYCFHDTGKHIKPKTHYQHIGSMTDSDMYISCRKAVDKIGLLSNKFAGWRIIYDEADEQDEAGGVVVIQKI